MTFIQIIHDSIQYKSICLCMQCAQVWPHCPHGVPKQWVSIISSDASSDCVHWVIIWVFWYHLQLVRWPWNTQVSVNSRLPKILQLCSTSSCEIRSDIPAISETAMYIDNRLCCVYDEYVLSSQMIHCWRQMSIVKA